MKSRRKARNTSVEANGHPFYASVFIRRGLTVRQTSGQAAVDPVIGFVNLKHATGSNENRNEVVLIEDLNHF